MNLIKMYFPFNNKLSMEGMSVVSISLLVLANTIRVYEFVLFVRVIFSWIGMFNPNIYRSKIFFALSYITDPLLDFIRRHIPSMIGFLDLSVLWLFLLLELIYYVIVRLSYTFA